MGILEIKDLRLTLGDKPILNGLTADFWEGHVHAIVGPNGAGKSTLASTLMGLSGYREVKGSIIFNGQDIVPLTIDQRARLADADLKVLGILESLIEAGIEAGDLDLPDGASPLMLCLTLWSMFEGSTAALRGGIPLAQAGVADPMAA